MIPVNGGTAGIRVSNIDERIFNTRYFARCMECTSCRDDCCSYGCPVDIMEVERIYRHRVQLEDRLGIPASVWFHDEVVVRPEFPSGRVRNTRVVNGACAFHNNRGRGCHLHGYALEQGIDPHLIKPMVCFLFPLTWDGDYLYVSEFLDELPCRHGGLLICDSQLEELACYLGGEFVREMEAARNSPAPDKAVT